MATGCWECLAPTLGTEGSRAEGEGWAGEDCFIAVSCHIWQPISMEFLHLLRVVGDGPVSKAGLHLAGEVEPAGVRRQLSRWTSKGQLRRFLPNHALRQTGWDRAQVTGENRRRMVRHRLEGVTGGRWLPACARFSIRLRIRAS